MKLTQRIKEAQAVVDELNRDVKNGTLLTLEECAQLLELIKQTRCLRDLMVVHALAAGTSAKDVALKFGLSTARISQIKTTYAEGNTDD